MFWFLKTCVYINVNKCVSVSSVVVSYKLVISSIKHFVLQRWIDFLGYHILSLNISFSKILLK